ncbi:MAG: 23S rRNA (guanosine(2251)-2'-O)-methyltransferase RlmB [Calditrichaceae bacterium]
MKNEQEKLHIFGRQPVLEALRSGHKVEEIWLADGLEGKWIAFLERAAGQKNVSIKSVSKNDIQKLVGPVVHQGVAAVINGFSYMNEDGVFKYLETIEMPFILLLDQVQDPHNLGAIMRTAEVAGVNLIIIPEKGSPDLNATIAKTSAGAMFHIPVCKAPTVEKILEDLTKSGITSVAAIAHSEKNLYDVDFTGGTVIVIGSEGRGVRKNIAGLCSEQIAIPQYGKINSLNASVASAVIMYEVVRQRHHQS